MEKNSWINFVRIKRIEMWISLLIGYCYIYLTIKLIELDLSKGKYKTRAIHDDMFLSYASSDNQDNYNIFRREWYNNLIREQKFF
jgi:hypothetical protein